MRSTFPFVTATILAVACGDGGSGPPPDDDGNRAAAQFERLADSVESGGYSPAAEALRHAAEIVRLTGHATPVTVTIDGSARSFHAVAEQIDFPNLVCSWPSDSGFVPPPDTVVVPPPDTASVPPDSGGGMPPVDSGVVHPPFPPEPPECHVESTYSMRTLIAWEPEEMNEVVRLVAYDGPSTVNADVPDVMTGLPGGTVSDPGTTPPDSGGGSGGEPGGWPGFMGEYLVRDVGSWYANEGSQTNDLIGSNGDCTSRHAEFDWAEFDCSAARYRFEFAMGVEPVRYEPLTGVADPPGGPEGQHDIAMSSSEVDGVRLAWVSWSPPPLPPIPGPIDSTGVEPMSP